MFFPIVLGKSKTIDLLEWSTIWIYTHPRICEYGGHQDHWRNWCLDLQLPCYSFQFLFFLKHFWGFPGCSVVENLPRRGLPRKNLPRRGLPRKNLPRNVGDMGSISGLGRFLGEGNGNPLQYSCLKNPWTEEPGGL